MGFCFSWTCRPAGHPQFESDVLIWSLNIDLQDSGATVPEVEEDSDLEEEAALRFYRDMEKQLKLKRKGNDPEAEE